MQDGITTTVPDQPPTKSTISARSRRHLGHHAQDASIDPFHAFLQSRTSVEVEGYTASTSSLWVSKALPVLSTLQAMRAS